MTELLAVPGWNTPATRLAAWVECLRTQGLTVDETRESPGVSWLASTTDRLRGYVVLNGSIVEAIHFELLDPDPAEARRLVESAAASIGWEVHEEDDDEDDAGTSDD